MRVKLLHATPKIEDDLFMSFYISGISRSLLQELVRHDHETALSVKSSRYTLKELKNEEPFTSYDKDKDIYHVTPNQAKRAGEYLVFTHDHVVDRFSIMALDNLRITLKQGISNDKAKYCLPESYKTELTWTINLRSLQNFLSLRSDKSALWEIRKLAHEVFNAVPNTHKYLLEDSLKEMI